MAKFFYDFEFHEHTIKKRLFRRHEFHTIEPISLGMVSDKGEELYVVYKDFDLEAAWNHEWLRDNVLVKIYYSHESSAHNYFDIRTLREIIKEIGFTKSQIAEKIIEFCNPSVNTVELYAWYSAYDHIAFSNTFGTMDKLPKGIPMYTNDLQQDFDNLILDLGRIGVALNKVNFNDLKEVELIKNPTFEDYDNALKNRKDYPKQINEHSAIADARWDRNLYNFIQNAKENLLYKKS